MLYKTISTLIKSGIDFTVLIALVDGGVIADDVKTQLISAVVIALINFLLLPLIKVLFKKIKVWTKALIEKIKVKTPDNIDKVLDKAQEQVEQTLDETVAAIEEKNKPKE
jgi:hypothetical protein